jgi:hypothetical protein
MTVDQGGGPRGVLDTIRLGLARPLHFAQEACMRATTLANSILGGLNLWGENLQSVIVCGSGGFLVVFLLKALSRD